MGINQNRYLQNLRSEIMNSKEEAIDKLYSMVDSLDIERADGVQIISRYRSNNKIISLVGVIAIDENMDSNLTIVNAEESFITKDEFNSVINELKELINNGGGTTDNTNNNSGNTSNENSFIAVYNITSITESTPLFGVQEYFSYDDKGNEVWGSRCKFNITLIDKMYIDGKEIKPTSAYTFSSIGHHTIKCSFREGRLTSCEGLFTKGLISVDLTSLDTSSSLNMNSMFYGCDELKDIDVSKLNTSKIRDMGGMFNGCSGLTSLDLSNFDTSNVTNMSGMFKGCSGLTSLDLSNFDTSNVTKMSSMFNGCTGLTALNLKSFDTSNVTTMQWMFSGCRLLFTLDVGMFNTKKVTDMSHMFQFCRELTSIDLSNFDTSNVTDMSYMFHGDVGLTSLDLSTFNTSNVTIMVYMFADCTNLESLKILGDISTVKSYGQMFRSINKTGTIIYNCAYTEAWNNILETYKSTSNFPTSWTSTCVTV